MHKVSMSPGSTREASVAKSPLALRKEAVLSYCGSTEALLGQLWSQDRRLMR